MRGSKPDANGSQKLLSKEVRQLPSYLSLLSLYCVSILNLIVPSSFSSCFFFQDEDLKWVEENIPTTVADV